MTGVRIGAALGLAAAATYFLWMFVAVAPLESIADIGGVAGADIADATVITYRFAADWRHGMAGNSPIYMPGFFALALATWFWSASGARTRDLIIQGVVILALSVAIAWTYADAARSLIITAFERSSGLVLVAPWPTTPVRAIAHGMYTAVAWTTSVAACRRALERRSFSPLLVVPPVTLVLVLVRPWTVDHFVGLWIARARTGSAAAILSAIAIPILVYVFVRLTPAVQRVQTQRRACRIGGAA